MHTVFCSIHARVLPNCCRPHSCLTQSEVCKHLVYRTSRIVGPHPPFCVTFQAEIESLSQNLEQVESQLSRSQREASQLDNQLQEAQVCLLRVRVCSVLFFAYVTSYFVLTVKLHKVYFSYKM